MTRSCVLSKEPFDALLQLFTFVDDPDGAGAVASFTGIARPTTIEGKPVTAMFLDHHPRMTIQSMRNIVEDADQRFDVQRIRVVHRCGRVEAGKPIVFVAASASHRQAALEAVNYLIDRLKTDAIFWKREDSPSGRNWIEPTARDYEARASWD